MKASKKLERYLATHDYEPHFQNLWDTAKAVSREKFIRIYEHKTRKQEKSSNRPNLSSQRIEKNKAKVSRRKET